MLVYQSRTPPGWPSHQPPLTHCGVAEWPACGPWPLLSQGRTLLFCVAGCSTMLATDLPTSHHVPVAKRCAPSIR
eukprot:365052-Chlamydomonas_euryale.AAC.37